MDFIFRFVPRNIYEKNIYEIGGRDGGKGVNIVELSFEKNEPGFRPCIWLCAWISFYVVAENPGYSFLWQFFF